MSDGYDERMRRWRLVLGEAGVAMPLNGGDARIDAALGALYDSDENTDRTGSPQRQAGFGASAPRVARWLGDIRTFFPVSVVQVMQKDAIERLGLTRLLLEPEMLEAVEPDVHLVGTLLSLSRVIPEKARESARAVVRAVTRDIERRLSQRTRSAVAGALNRASRTSRPRRPADIDWDRTIRANLRNYLPEQRTIVPERLIGYARKQQAVARDVILCLDQSGSMASSVVYAGVFGAVLASIRSLRTCVVAFDTSVVDLTGQLSDPVDVLFGTQLGGGTDINQALAYCQQLITRPGNTIFILISDLYEGGDRDADAAPDRGHDRRGHAGDRAAGAVRRRGARLRPRQRGRAGRARRGRVRLHPGRIPRPDGRRHRAPRHHSVVAALSRRAHLTLPSGHDQGGPGDGGGRGLAPRSAPAR